MVGENNGAKREEVICFILLFLFGHVLYFVEAQTRKKNPETNEPSLKSAAEGQWAYLFISHFAFWLTKKWVRKRLAQKICP